MRISYCGAYIVIFVYGKGGGEANQSSRAVIVVIFTQYAVFMHICTMLLSALLNNLTPIIVGMSNVSVGYKD